MAKTAMIRARVEPHLKRVAEATLDAVGLTPTTAITLFYRQVVVQKGLPFDVRIRHESVARHGVRSSDETMQYDWPRRSGKGNNMGRIGTKPRGSQSSK